MIHQAFQTLSDADKRAAYDQGADVQTRRGGGSESSSDEEELPIPPYTSLDIPTSPDNLPNFPCLARRAPARRRSIGIRQP